MPIICHMQYVGDSFDTFQTQTNLTVFFQVTDHVDKTKRLQMCDVHIQYDTSTFMGSGFKMFKN